MGRRRAALRRGADEEDSPGWRRRRQRSRAHAARRERSEEARGSVSLLRTLASHSSISLSGPRTTSHSLKMAYNAQPHAGDIAAILAGNTSLAPVLQCIGTRGVKRALALARLARRARREQRIGFASRPVPRAWRYLCLHTHPRDEPRVLLYTPAACPRERKAHGAGEFGRPLRSRKTLARSLALTRPPHRSPFSLRHQDARPAPSARPGGPAQGALPPGSLGRLPVGLRDAGHPAQRPGRGRRH